MIKREYVVAKRIVLEDNVINSKAVLKDAPRQVMVVTSLDDVEYLTVKKGGYVILDFGRKLQGGVVLSVLGASLGDEGGADIVNRSLDLLRDMTPSDKWMNTVVSYTMWWVITHRDWYMYTGNLEYLLEQKEYFYAVVENIMNLNDENNEYNSKMHSFIDWSAKDKPQEWAGLRAVTVMSLEAAADIANAFGDYEFSKKCILRKNQVANHNVDGAEEIKQITAICALAGLMDMQKASDILEKDGAKGLSSFMGYYVTQVIAKAGRMDKALDIIRQFWGGMLDMGATSFWEDFDIEWMKNAAPITDIVPEGKDDIHGDFGKYCYTQFRHSLCHGWASNPTAFMSQYVLGIFPVEAGFKKVKIKPDLGNLKWAKGKFPTPYGEICVEHKVVDGKVVTNVTAPDEIEIIK